MSGVPARTNSRTRNDCMRVGSGDGSWRYTQFVIVIVRPFAGSVPAMTG